MNGTVKFFDHGKGWGFLTPDNSRRDLFVHGAMLAEGEQVAKGDRVEFEIGVSAKDGRPEAKRVRKI